LDFVAWQHPNKADGDEFRMNPRRVATGLVHFVDIPAKFILDSSVPVTFEAHALKAISRGG
jgi:hypothetical protein